MKCFCASKQINILLVFSLLAVSASAQLDIVIRGPYLQKLTSASIVIKWRTLLPSTSAVNYGLSEANLDQKVEDIIPTSEHTITISGLQPFTKYYYNIGTTTAVLQSGADNHFMTAPIPGTEGKYTFWVTGDCGNNSTNQRNVLEAYNNYMGDKVTHGWLTLGDNAYLGGLDVEFTTSFFDIYQQNISKHAPLWPAPGNHDYNNLPVNQILQDIPYYDIFDLPSNGEAGGVPSGTEAYYSYDYGNVHFLSLDSYGQEELMYRLYDTLGPQAQWIKQDLAANTKPWVIAYWHHPPYTMASHNSDTEGELVSMREAFVPFLEKLGVDLVFGGHSHGYERSRPMRGHTGMESTFSPTMNIDQSSGKYDGSDNSCTYMYDEKHTDKGTIYIVAGSSGQLGGSQSSYPHDAMYFSDVENGGSTVIEVEGNRLDLKWLNADGQIRDNFTYIKNSNKEHDITINKGENLTLTASWPGTYKWSHTQSTERTQVVTPTSSRSYTVTDDNQCVSDVYHVTVQDPNGVATVNVAESFRLFPNPANNELNIESNIQSLMSVAIKDITGRIVHFDNVGGQNSYKRKINTSAFPKGIYLVQLKDAKGNGGVQKLVIE